MIPVLAKNKVSPVLVLERPAHAKRELSPRIIELREKIHDEEYLNGAVQRIAQVISKKLLDTPEELLLLEDYP